MWAVNSCRHSVHKNDLFISKFTFPPLIVLVEVKVCQWKVSCTLCSGHYLKRSVRGRTTVRNPIQVMGREKTKYALCKAQSAKASRERNSASQSLACALGMSMKNVACAKRGTVMKLRLAVGARAQSLLRVRCPPPQRSF